MATARSLLSDALIEASETESDVSACLWQERPSVKEQDNGLVWEVHDIHAVAVDALPDRKFDAGFGFEQGPRVIAFSDKYVYVRVVYDGSEGMQAVPRHPEYVAEIPELGG